jgi:predicted PurR-regulated permease PerM
MIVLACLYWAQAVFIPIAIAVYLTIILGPFVVWLQRWRLGRALSVLVPVALTTMVIVVTAWIIAAQARTLASEMPTYAENIREKIKSLREMSQSPLTRRLENMVRDVSSEFSPPPANEAEHAAASAPSVSPALIVQRATPPWLTFLPSLLGGVVETLAGVIMTLILLIFMLFRREDLRNRLLRLVGNGRLTATTRALDDASQRISRYLLMQLVVNGIFGLTLSLGLLAIGLPYALLWGFSGFLMRYIPYVGVWVAALPPITLSMVMFPGWLQPLLVIGLFLAIEVVTSNLIEPRLYGHSIGVSEIAFLVAAAFGAFLWGPVGIILSSPAIVCLVVLGRHVPFFGFLDVLLGDDAALAPDVSYYQRLLANNRVEAREIVRAEIEKSSLQAAFDETVVPALTYFKRDRDRGELSEAKCQFVLDATAQALAEFEGGAGACDVTMDGGAERVRIIACPARDEADRLALVMLAHLLPRAKWDIEISASGMLASDLIARIAERRPALVCIAAVPPGGLARACYLIKRLRARFPSLKLVVGRWGLSRGLESNRERLRSVGVHHVSATLSDTLRQLRSLLPSLLWEQSRDQARSSAPEEKSNATNYKPLHEVAK